MEKVLVIVADTNLYFFPGFKSDTVDFCQLFARKTHKPFNGVKSCFLLLRALITVIGNTGLEISIALFYWMPPYFKTKL